jgi:hypothetical protein
MINPHFELGVLLALQQQAFMCCARSFVDFFAVEVMTLSMEGGPDR